MLYSRVFECEVGAARIRLPSEFRIQVPANLRVLEPIAVALASIGVVDDEALGVKYIPVAKPMKNGVYRPHDPEDVTEFLEWTQYDWNTSWAQVEQGREARRKMAAEDGIKLPEKMFPPNHSKLLEWENLALEKWLGWDEGLWHTYQQMAQMVSRKVSFIDFPKHLTGNYAWLLPRVENEKGALCKVPKPSVGSDAWMVALLFDFGALPSERTNTWYHETRPVENVSDLLTTYLESAIKE